MDGNKRWAKKNKVSTKNGYLKGLENIYKVSQFCIDQKIKNLTIYALSNENMQRKSIGLIFEILSNQYKKIYEEFDIKKNIKINIIGEKEKLPKNIINIINNIESKTKNNKILNLNVALNYGTDKEIVSVVKNILKNNRNYQNITKEIIYKCLYLSDFPDPDILIRTGGFKRLSNFILLNLSYTEMFFLDTLWPDLSNKELLTIIEKFKKIKRNYGL